MVSVFAVPQAGQVIVELGITAGSSTLKHGADTGCPGRIGENRLPEILGGKVATNSNSKEVDHFVDMRTDEMAPRMRPLLSSVRVL